MIFPVKETMREFSKTLKEKKTPNFVYLYWVSAGNLKAFTGILKTQP